jgi:hypothetical protein
MNSKISIGHNAHLLTPDFFAAPVLADGLDDWQQLHVEACGRARVESFPIIIGCCRSLPTCRLRCHRRRSMSSRGDDGAAFWFA